MEGQRFGQQVGVEDLRLSRGKQAVTPGSHSFPESLGLAAHLGWAGIAELFALLGFLEGEEGLSGSAPSQTMRVRPSSADRVSQGVSPCCGASASSKGSQLLMSSRLNSSFCSSSVSVTGWRRP